MVRLEGGVPYIVTVVGVVGVIVSVADSGVPDLGIVGAGEVVVERSLIVESIDDRNIRHPTRSV